MRNITYALKVKQYRAYVMMAVGLILNRKLVIYHIRLNAHQKIHQIPQNQHLQHQDQSQCQQIAQIVESASSI